jgi:glucose-1-phosphate thymidylyltransferase
MMILGDNIFQDNLAPFVKKFKKGGMIFVRQVPDPQRFGIAEFDKKGRVISIEEKPQQPKSNYCVTGAYVYDNKVIKIAKNLKPSSRGEIEITDINNKYLIQGELTAHKIKGEWLDAGTFDSLLEAGNIVKQKKIYKNFHPLVDSAIADFNAEMKEICKKKLF